MADWFSSTELRPLIIDHMTLICLASSQWKAIEPFLADALADLARAATISNYVPLLTERFARDHRGVLTQAGRMRCPRRWGSPENRPRWADASY